MVTLRFSVQLGRNTSSFVLLFQQLFMQDIRSTMDSFECSQNLCENKTLVILFEVFFQQFVFIYTKAYTGQTEDRTVPCLRVTRHKVDLSLSEIITAFQGQKSISNVYEHFYNCSRDDNRIDNDCLEFIRILISLL